MNKFSIYSIRFKYFITTAFLIIISICSFFFIAKQTTLNTSLEQKRTQDLSTLNNFSASVQSYMSSIEAIGQIVSKDTNVCTFLDTALKESEYKGKEFYKQLDNQALWDSYTNSLSPILALSVMDPEFFFVGEKKLNLDRLNYFFNSTTMKPVAMNPTMLYWTKTFSLELLKEHSVHKVFALTVPTYNSDNTLLGYVVLFVENIFLNDLLQTYTNDIYVIEGDNIIGATKELPRNANLFSEMKISYARLLEDSSVILQTSDDYTIITTRFFSPLDIHLLLVSSYQDLKNNLAIHFPPMITFVIYGILLALLIAFVFSRLQTKHILELKKIMNLNKQGNLTVRFQPKTKDEIAELGLTFNSLLDRIQQLMLEQKQHQRSKRRLELQMIQEQVKPHFLYNVLEMINSMIRCNMQQEAMATVEHLACFYRISLSHGSGIISIQQEFDLIENYLCLQKLRYIEFMDYVLAFSPNIRKYKVPKLTLQPLIENSIYHGIKEKDGKGIICVSGYFENGFIIIEVFDTGIGISPEKLKELRQSLSESTDDSDCHFGISSVIKRLNLHYNGQASITIGSQQNQFTCVTLSFPAIEYYEKGETGIC